MQIDYGEGTVLGMVLTGMIGLAGWIRRNQNRADGRDDKVRDEAARATQSVASDLADFREQVAKERASVEYVAAVERRGAEAVRALKDDVITRLGRIEDKLDGYIARPRNGG